MSLVSPPTAYEPTRVALLRDFLAERLRPLMRSLQRGERRETPRIARRTDLKIEARAYLAWRPSGVGVLAVARRDSSPVGGGGHPSFRARFRARTQHESISLSIERFTSVRSAATDPLVESRVIRQRGVRALYGVPLIDAGAVVGVAYIGSLTFYEFGEEDRRMLDGLAARAAAAIYQQMLRRDAERRAAELNAVIESIPDAVFIADGKRITTATPAGSRSSASIRWRSCAVATPTFWLF